MYCQIVKFENLTCFNIHIGCKSRDRDIYVIWEYIKIYIKQSVYIKSIYKLLTVAISFQIFQEKTST